MERRANYEIVRQTENYVLIRDIGPHDEYLTITNDAEGVVKDLKDVIGNRRLFYIDSSGSTDELLMYKGRFVGFSFGFPFEE